MLQAKVDRSRIVIETDHLAAVVETEGYTSGVKAGSFVDKRTGARDLGFGLSIVDFLLEPSTLDRMNEPGQYDIAPAQPLHGRIPKRYVEGPQICTQAKKLPFEIVRGTDFLAVKLWYKYHKPYPPYQAGSRWAQILVFPENRRYFFSADRVTSVNDHPALILRIDMPGHLKHKRGDTFEQIHLSYIGNIPSSAFHADFGPDAKFLYRRDERRPLERMIRGYQVRLDGRPGPWLAGITLEPADVWEAWCHQRGYVCMIEEIGGRPVRAGQTFGACYCIGWFDHVEEIEATAATYRGWSGLGLLGPTDKPTQFVGLAQHQLPPVRPIPANPV